jgi:hypothetical protein
MRSALLNAAAATALFVTAAVAQTQPSTGGDAGQGTSGQQMNQGGTAGQGATTPGATTGGATTGGNTVQGTTQGTGANTTTCVPGQPNCPTDAGAADANAPSTDGQNTTTEQTGGADAGQTGGADAGAAQQGAGQGGDAQQQQGQTEQNQPGAADAPEITTEQRTVIRERIIERERDYKRVDIDFEINIGIGIPQTIELYPLPVEIVEIVPAYRGYRFFILDDGTIVIVHPVEYEIVYVIYA